MSKVKTIKATGADGQVNTLDVILRESQKWQHGILFRWYFHGQKKEMKADEEAKEWLEWSTEGIGQLLARRFQCLNIILVRPARMRQGHSCYDHFLTTNLNGDPRDGEYDSEGSASLHLLMLLEDLTVQMGIPKSDFLSSLHLVGFSKGAVVLNQLLAEFGADSALEESPPFRLLSITRTIEWLDPGISDGNCVFLTDEDLLRMAASRFRTCHPITGLYVVLSPFQLALDSYEFDYPEDEEACTSEGIGLGPSAVRHARGKHASRGGILLLQQRADHAYAFPCAERIQHSAYSAQCLRRRRWADRIRTRKSSKNLAA